MSPSALAETRRVRPLPAPAPDPAETPILPVSHDGRRVSEDDYWRDYYLESDIHYEWNNGILEEKPVSDAETIAVYHWFLGLLLHYLETHPIARLVALEFGFRLPLPTGTVIRKPDFAVVRNDNPEPLLPLDASYRGIFDLCVEALSDKERRGIERDTRVKKAEYAAAGVPEYYILHRERERLAFFTRSPSGLYVQLEQEDGTIHSRVLPGLRFRPDDLIRRPEYATLRDDPVYAEFVLPGWHAAEERMATVAQELQAARKQAAAEARRARAAERRAAAEVQARQAAEGRAAAAERQAREARQALARLQAQRENSPGEG
jgi:Uma2 family endonuclease